MKKIIVRSIIVLLVLFVVAIAVVGFYLDSIVKKGVETVGPQIAKVSVQLDSVSLSLLSGSGKVKGLVVGNPEGYKAPQAIKVGTASVAVNPASVLSDKIVVRSIRLEAPEITFEGNPMQNNLTKILDNVNASAGGETAQKQESKAGKKLQVDDFLITGAKVHIGANGPAFALPDIHLSNLGTGSEGITAADLTQRVLSALVAGTLKVVASAATDIGKHAAEAGREIGKDAGKTVGEGVEKVGKGIGDLFKKK